MPIKYCVRDKTRYTIESIRFPKIGKLIVLEIAARLIYLYGVFRLSLKFLVWICVIHISGQSDRYNYCNRSRIELSLERLQRNRRI